MSRTTTLPHLATLSTSTMEFTFLLSPRGRLFFSVPHLPGCMAGSQSFSNTEELKSSSIDVAAEDNLISKPMLLGEEPINYGRESESQTI